MQIVYRIERDGAGNPLHFTLETNQETIVAKLMQGRQEDFVFFEEDGVNTHQVVARLREVAGEIEFPSLFENLQLPWVSNNASPLLCYQIEKGLKGLPNRIDVTRPQFIGTFEHAVDHLTTHKRLYVSSRSELGKEIRANYRPMQERLWGRGCIIVPGQPSYTLAYRPERASNRSIEVKERRRLDANRCQLGNHLDDIKIVLTVQLVWLRNAIWCDLSQHGCGYHIGLGHYRVAGYDTRGPVGTHPSLLPVPIQDWSKSFSPTEIATDLHDGVEKLGLIFSIMTGGEAWIRSKPIQDLMVRWREIGRSIKTNWMRFRTLERRYDLLKSQMGVNPQPRRLFIGRDPLYGESRRFRILRIRMPGGGHQVVKWPVIFDWLDKRSVRLYASRPFRKPRGLPRPAPRRKK